MRVGQVHTLISVDTHSTYAACVHCHAYACDMSVACSEHWLLMQYFIVLAPVEDQHSCVLSEATDRARYAHNCVLCSLSRPAVRGINGAETASALSPPHISGTGADAARPPGTRLSPRAAGAARAGSRRGPAQLGRPEHAGPQAGAAGAARAAPVLRAALVRVLQQHRAAADVDHLRAAAAPSARARERP